MSKQVMEALKRAVVEMPRKDLELYARMNALAYLHAAVIGVIPPQVLEKVAGQMLIDSGISQDEAVRMSELSKDVRDKVERILREAN